MGKTRPWKTAKTGAASSTINVSKCGSGLKPSWDQRMKERAARAAVQAAQREVDEQIRQEKEGNVTIVHGVYCASMPSCGGVGGVHVAAQGRACA